MLRMMRFMNFLKVMFEEIYGNREIKMTDVCSKAYLETLYPYHT